MIHRLITTSIPYMNSAPHVGFAMEMALSDTLARHSRAAGHGVTFVTGSDEHGTKIWKKAQELGKPVMEMLDGNVAVFRELNAALRATPDEYVRTTDQGRHWKCAQEIWRRLEANGDLYRKKYSGFYCDGCETFMTQKDLDAEGNCPTHKRPAQKVEEENWFFRLSKYGPKVLELVEKGARGEAGGLRIVPEFRANEVLAFLRDGLEDVSFSRSKDKMPWGIPVPGDDSQVMYVWCDALTNYLTGAGFPEAGWEAKWPAYLHVIGKDISRFHAMIWPAMLMAAGIATPQNLLVHGFVLDANGQKMSKSLGNTVDPLEQVAAFGGDALRFYLCTEAGPGQDMNFDAARLKAVFNDQLANNAGNFASRTSAMFAKNFPEGCAVPEGFVPDAGFAEQISAAYSDYAAAFKDFDVRAAVQSVFRLLDEANAYLNRTEPWKVKDDAARLGAILLTCMEVNYHVTQMLAPVLPDFAEKMKPALGFSDFRIDPSFGFVASRAGKTLKISKPEIVFQRKA